MNEERQAAWKALAEFIKRSLGYKNNMAIATKLEIRLDTLKNWLAGRRAGYVEKEIKNIHNKFFENSEIIENCLKYLKDTKKYNINRSLIDECKNHNDRFNTFLNDFLTGKIDKINPPVGNANTPEEDYLEQCVSTIADNNVVFTLSSTKEINRAELIEIDELHRIFITGPGGQGKSTLLKKLSDSISKEEDIRRRYKHVFRIVLADLFNDDNNEIADDALFNLLQNHLENPDIELWKALENPNRSQKVLLLLDDLNGIYSHYDNRSVQRIKTILEYVNNNWQNTTIIMTSRPMEGEPDFLTEYKRCCLSGTPTDRLDKLRLDELIKDGSIRGKIEELAKIPMYYNFLVNNLDKVTDINAESAKYDLLFQMYSKHYEQSRMDIDDFFAYYILAPFVAQKIHDNPNNKITEASIRQIINNFRDQETPRNMREEYNLLFKCALDECEKTMHGVVNIDKAEGILMGKGPLEKVKGGYRIFHDDIRDFLIAFLTLISFKAMKEACNEAAFDYIRYIKLNLNLKDEPIELIKSKMGLSEGDDVKNLKDNYDVINNPPMTPQKIIFAHTLFLISDYMSLGSTAVEPTCNILNSFTNKIIRFIETNQLDYLFRKLEPEDCNRCKNAISDIMSKYCENFRRQGEYIRGIEYAEIAEKIQENNVAIKNQKGKLLIFIYQSHIKDGVDYSIQDLGYENYIDVYRKARELLGEAATEDFNLSANLEGTLYSFPAPFLFKDKENNEINFDFCKAFNMYCNPIFTNKQINYTVKEIEYPVKQAVGLLLKGYVKWDSTKGEYEEGYLPKDQVTDGDRSTCKIDKDTISLAKNLLAKIKDGGNKQGDLNYYRGIIAWYDDELDSAKYFLEKAGSDTLATVFRYYHKEQLGITEDFDLDNDVYKKISDMLKENKRNQVDLSNPIYWYCDAKNLERSCGCGNERNAYFTEFENSLDEICINHEGMADICKYIVEQLTQ